MLTFIISVSVLSSRLHAQDKWQNADEATVRLKPSAFSRLPKSIVSYLETRGCTVPQISGETTPHNVIRGEFAQSGQFDWAVLCSRQRVSAIWVFWNGSTKAVARFAEANDKHYLQTTSEGGGIGFSRAIDVAAKDYIFKQQRGDNGKKLPPIKHQGISDAFIEKASTVRYFYRGRWLQLQGAD